MRRPSWPKLMHHGALMLAVAAGSLVSGSARPQYDSAISAAPSMVNAEAQTQSVDCAGRPAELSGSHNNLVFSGGCRTLSVRGDANTIDIWLASAASLDIRGSGNHIRYTLAPGTQPPTLKISGNDTDLAPLPGSRAPLAPDQDTALTGNRQRMEFDCVNRQFGVRGNQSHYVLRGGCRGLTIRGDGNVVAADLAANASVLIEGNATLLTYVSPGPGEPVRVIRGAGSSATRVTTLPAPFAPSASDLVIKTVLPVAPIQADPALMQSLNGHVVATGTLVAFLTADKLFDGPTAILHGDAPGRLTSIVQMVQQINPSGLLITIAEAGDVDLARQRAAVIRTWLAAVGDVRLPIRTTTEPGTGATAISMLILRQP